MCEFASEEPLIGVIVTGSLTGKILIEEDVPMGIMSEWMLGVALRVANELKLSISNGIRFYVEGSPFIVGAKDLPNMVHGTKDLKLCLMVMIFL